MSNISSDELFHLVNTSRNLKNTSKIEKLIENVTDIALRKDVSYITHPVIYII